MADNLLQRDFNAAEPFKKLATDVTQFKIRDKKIYLSPIMDLYNNEIVAYSISLHPDLAQMREMLEKLSERLPQGARPVLPSDQGWQYQHAMFQRYLEDTILRKVCPAKAIVWTTAQWNVSLED